jgi:hypothetical protein
MRLVDRPIHTEALPSVDRDWRQSSGGEPPERELTLESFGAESEAVVTRRCVHRRVLMPNENSNALSRWERR